MFDVKYSNQAQKFLNKAENIVAKRILDEIEKLQQNPFPKDVKRVEASEFHQSWIGGLGWNSECAQKPLCNFAIATCHSSVMGGF